jgi:hypothetical protein
MGIINRKYSIFHSDAISTDEKEEKFGLTHLVRMFV